ncbi:Acid phosphatase [Aphelenchoides bicaudatus]|nr:Acid phosphatase [Aphelenchoides bicaudatus]
MEIKLVLYFLLPALTFASEKFRYAKPATPIDDDPEWNLVFTQTLWRHGDRSPVFQIPNDPITAKNWTRSGGGFGQLSPARMAQHMRLGEKLRNRYNDFVSKKYVDNEVYVRSTDVNRTLMSALSNMIGFYPKNSGVAGEDYPDVAGWPAGFNFVPIHTVPEMNDPVSGVHNCSYEKKAFRALKTTPEYKKAVEDHRDLINKVIELTGIKKFELEDIKLVRDTLFVEKVSDIPGIQMPSGFTEELFEQIDELAGIVDDLEDGIGVAEKDNINFRIELPKLTGGPLLWTMIDHMELKRFCLDKKIDRTEEEEKRCRYFDPLRYYVFSAHDTTISSLFSTFGFQESNFNETGLPHYASCVLLELYQSVEDPGEYKVSVLYWPEAHGLIDVTHWITGCNHKCTLDTFINRSQSYRIRDMEKYCDGVETDIVETASVKVEYVEMHDFSEVKNLAKSVFFDD